MFTASSMEEAISILNVDFFFVRLSYGRSSACKKFKLLEACEEFLFQHLQSWVNESF